MGKKGAKARAGGGSRGRGGEGAVSGEEQPELVAPQKGKQRAKDKGGKVGGRAEV